MANYIISRANTLIFGALIVILVLVGGLTWDRYDAARTSREWTRHTYDVLATIRSLNLDLRRAESGQRGYLLTGDTTYLAPYEAALGRISLLQGRLLELTADDPAQQQRVQMLAPLVQRKLEVIAQTIQLRREGNMGGALRIIGTDVGRTLMVQIETTLTAMSAEEQSLLGRRMEATQARGAWVARLALLGTGLAILALLCAARILNRAWSRSNAAEAEQRRLAFRLRTSLDSLSQGVAVFGADLRLTDWNECFRVLLDIPRAMLRAGMPYAAFAEQAAAAGPNLLETEDQVRHHWAPGGAPVVSECIRADDQHLEVRRTTTPDGGFVLTITDLTKRAQAEAVLRESQKMQAIGQLTGGLAHDFNNLLTVILGNLEIIRARLDGQPALQSRIENATLAAQRGARLTSQLLSFARKQPLAPAPVDLAATVPELVPLLRRTLGAHIDVRYVETAGLWPALADPAQLEAAALNLALNARDAMPGGGRLTIELANKVLDAEYCRQHSEVTPGDYAMLAVSDTGHGMTPDVLARVFEPFFTTKPDGKGTGLGLAMVFGFVKQSGGHVNIYSEPGQGTTVRLYLPRAVGATTIARQGSASPIELPRGSATVLVVEDDPAVREVAASILMDLGYRVLEAADGAEALRVFGAQAEGVDLLLTDVVLPGEVRGREVAERLIAIRPQLRVLFMSGYTENAIVHQGRLDDGVQLLAKPFKREDLARKVAETLRSAPGSAQKDANVVEMKRRGG